MVTPHSYATCGYAGYATVTPNTVTPHGYATCGHVGYATVTPNTVTPHGYATIASVLLRLRDGGATIFGFLHL